MTGGEGRDSWALSSSDQATRESGFRDATPLSIAKFSVPRHTHRWWGFVPWTNVVGGALRMQMVSDVVQGLVARNSLPQEIAADIQLKSDMVLDPHREDWPTGLDEGIMGRTGGRRLAGPVSLTYAVTQRHRCWHLAVANSILKIKTILASRSAIHRPFEKPNSHFAAVAL